MSFGQQNPQSPDPQRPGSEGHDAHAASSQQTETLYPNQPGVQQPAQGWGAPGPTGPAAQGQGQGWGAPGPTGPAAQGQGQGWGAPGPTGPAAQGQGQGWGAPGPYAPGQGWDARPAGPVGTSGRYRSALSRLTPVQKGLAVAGIAVVVAAGAGAAVYAASNSGSSASAASSNQGFGGAPGQAGNGQGLGQAGTGQNSGGGFGGPGNLGVGGMGQAVHGEYVVQNNGQYVTELEQTGTITAVSGSQVTVKSVDGYVQAYAISSDTTIASFAGRRQSQSSGGSLSASSLESGQTVRVTALKDGNAALTILVSSTAGTSSNGSGSGTSGSGTSGSGT